MNKYTDKRFITFAKITLLANKLQAVMSIGMKDITPRQWLIMIMIGTFKEPPTLKELSNRCGITHQSAKQLLDRLIEKDYVSIVPDEKDRRFMRITLSEQAENWSRKYESRNAEFVYKLFEELSEEELDVYYKAQDKLMNKLVEVEHEKMGKDTQGSCSTGH